MRHAVWLDGRKLGNRAFIIWRKEERGTPMSLGYAGHARLEVEDDEIASSLTLAKTGTSEMRMRVMRSKARKGSLPSASPASSSWRCTERSKDCLTAGRGASRK